MFEEILRVLHPTGRLVFVGASGKVIHKLEVALRNARAKVDGGWSIVAKRSFFLTGKVTAVMAVAENVGHESLQDVGWKGLAWEGQAPDNGRDLYNHWRMLRALDFPTLRPAFETALPSEPVLIHRHISNSRYRGFGWLMTSALLIGLWALKRQVL